MISRTSTPPTRPTLAGTASPPVSESPSQPTTSPAPGQRPAARSTVAPWQRSLGQAIHRLDDLLDILGLEEVQLADGRRARRGEAQKQFPLRVPRAYVERMVPGDADDPLLRQVLPLGDEMLDMAGFVADPLEEGPASPIPGLLHKYAGRVLMVTTGACAIHCRYCFRRHFPYAEHRSESRGDLLDPWRAALDYIASDASIDEVILSGGDPLSLNDDKLSHLAAALDAIPHLRRLRLHTRLPVVHPARVDDRLLDWLGKGRLQKVIVFHVNHGNEIDGNVGQVATELRQVGVTLLNQAVMLRGVNDSVDALVNLSQNLFDVGVLPYYLHMLDKVRGAAHFEVEEDKAQRLFQGLLARLPGFLVPRLVREVPAASSKVPVPLADR